MACHLAAIIRQVVRRSIVAYQNCAAKIWHVGALSVSRAMQMYCWNWPINDRPQPLHRPVLHTHDRQVAGLRMDMLGALADDEPSDSAAHVQGAT